MALSLLLGYGAPLSAQTNSGGIASATVSATQIGDGTSASIAGAMGYRVNPVVALGIEFMFVPNLTPDLPDIPAPLSAFEVGSVIYPSPVFTVGEDGGHATIFTTQLRLTIPTRSRRVSPFLVGGAGVATVTEKFQYTITYPIIPLVGVGGTVISPVFRPTVTESVAQTTTDFAATLGGGVSFLTDGRWSFDVDARYVGIFGQRDAQIGRFGGGVTYRF
jgi:hypothetical protein